MKVIIDSYRIEELSIIDIKTGIDWTVDLLGDAGIHRDADTDAVAMSQKDYNWWKTYIERHQATEQEIIDLARLAGVETYEIRNEVFEYMGQQDMENERGRAIQRLADLKEEYGVS